MDPNCGCRPSSGVVTRQIGFFPVIPTRTSGIRHRSTVSNRTNQTLVSVNSAVSTATRVCCEAPTDDSDIIVLSIAGISGFNGSTIEVYFTCWVGCVEMIPLTTATTAVVFVKWYRILVVVSILSGICLSIVDISKYIDVNIPATRSTSTTRSVGIVVCY